MVTSLRRRPWHTRRRVNWSSIGLVWPCSAPWNGRSSTTCVRWLSLELEAAEEEGEVVVPALGVWLPVAAHWLHLFACRLAASVFLLVA